MPPEPVLAPLLRRLAVLAARLLLRLKVSGQERVPRTGGVLLAMNHLGSADPIIVVGHSPRPLTVIGKSEIVGWPLVGLVARAYGMIPVRRGEPDRAPLKTAISLLRSGRALLVAPEGRESLSGALERAKEGPAFIAQHSGAPIVPVALTGTEWNRLLPAWRRLRRPYATLTFGSPFTLPPGLTRRAAADFMMRRIAELLPPAYRGVYADDEGQTTKDR